MSPPALVQAQAFVVPNPAAAQARFREHLAKATADGNEPVAAITDLKALLTDPDLFGWKDTDLVAADDPSARDLEVVLADYRETLRPTFAVPAPEGGWLLLVQELPPAADMDAVAADPRHWQASPQDRFVRLLRGTKVPIGLLSNGTAVRLVYAPSGHEAAGHVTFPVAAMTEVAGRPALAAALMLLGADRLFTLPDKQRLPALLADSRKYQNTVSTELAEQVLAALFELLRGFQAADDQRRGDLLRDVLARDPDEVYAGLVTVLMRLVFLLYAEQRGLMSDAEVYVQHYSVGGLYERLREDAGRYPDTMDQRCGAWAHLLATFRLTYDGGRHVSPGTRFEVMARHGYLFDADRYPFLEGRPRGSARIKGERIIPPLVSDGVVFRVLSNLLVVAGDRISYDTLNVEHIGSVYESIMGYRLEKAGGRSIALRPKKSGGAPVTVNLELLLSLKPADRAKWLSENADQKVDGKPRDALKAADTVEGLVAALEKRIARAITPNIVPRGGMILQPSDERRRSGSHYTPPTLTGPIVRKAIEPILEKLSVVSSQLSAKTENQQLTTENCSPTPEQILALKVCDPAMGSGAFLVEACRQLGDALLKAWDAHGQRPKVPDDEMPELLAQRTVAQRCLYGVDRNPMAVGLAKLSLWLATLAKNHPFTFLDHSLRDGDALVGLSAKQIRQFHWKPAEKMQGVFGQDKLRERLDTATRYRWQIIESGEGSPELLKEQKLKLADEALDVVRFAGNLAVAAFFAADKDKARQAVRDSYLPELTEYLRTGRDQPSAAERALTTGPQAVKPFHWEIEFPEVFGRKDAGFDVIVGNPPFAGKNTIGEGNRDGYLDWLKAIHDESHGNADLVAHFFRRAFGLLRPGGTFGLIATNTIAQGDTRSSGLRWICTNGGTIYAARRRYKWPGQAAVVVSVVHVAKGPMSGPFELDGKPADRVTAYLFHAGGHDDPKKLAANANKSFQGSIVLGMGFTFDDTDPDGVANSLGAMRELIAKDARNAERIFPYIGGEEVNDSPTHAHHRYVINFGEMGEEDARKWPDLMKIVEERVRPGRMKQGDKGAKEKWWQFIRPRQELIRVTQDLQKVHVCCLHQPHWCVSQLAPTVVFSHALAVFALSQNSAFCAVQSRVHEVWARFFASSMKDDLRYTPSDCFETFPFPPGVLTENRELATVNGLEAAGQAYFEFRADLMVRNNEGLTKTYNRFHDPNETSADIARLRELHAAMDRAVLDAYGGDLAALAVPPCEFLLDYEDEADEDEEPATGRQRKKPWRYRWPDAFRDQVLALLLDLNAQRAEQERLTALPPSGVKEIKVRNAIKTPKPKGFRIPDPPAVPPFAGYTGGLRHSAGDLDADGTVELEVRGGGMGAVFHAGPNAVVKAMLPASAAPALPPLAPSDPLPPLAGPPADEVQCGVFAPPEVARGATAMVQVFAFLTGREAEAKALATEFDAAATRRGQATLRAAVRRGQTIRFHLRLPFPTDPPTAELVWRGETEGVQFEVAVPKSHPLGDTVGVVTAVVDEVPVGTVRFKLAVTAAKRKRVAPAPPATLAADHRASRFKRAFVSYSSKDREKIVPAVGVLELAATDYFQDVRDLVNGEPWRAQLEEKIDECDLFLLFWSSNARASEEVGKEIARVVARLGPDRLPPPLIWPCVIETPPPPPPDALKDLHFRSFYHPKPAEPT